VITSRTSGKIETTLPFPSDLLATFLKKEINHEEFDEHYKVDDFHQELGLQFVRATFELLLRLHL
jgi:hypothetical protein